jgi:hypothetical protein
MTMTLISTVTVGSGGAANIEFTAIAGTATDLLVVYSGRDNRTGTNYTDDVKVEFNGSTTNLSARVLYGGSGSTGSFSSSVANAGYVVGTDATSNTFGSSQIYIPNYAGSTNKSFSVDGVAESNHTNGVFAMIAAGLWSNTAAITSLKLLPVNGTTFLQYTTASLYSITKGSGGATVS